MQNSTYLFIQVQKPIIQRMRLENGQLNRDYNETAQRLLSVPFLGGTLHLRIILHFSSFYQFLTTGNNNIFHKVMIQIIDQALMIQTIQKQQVGNVVFHLILYLSIHHNISKYSRVTKQLSGSLSYHCTRCFINVIILSNASFATSFTRSKATKQCCICRLCSARGSTKA